MRAHNLIVDSLKFLRKVCVIGCAIPFMVGCGSIMSVEEAKTKYEPISKSRPLGCKSGMDDSASIKRSVMHPTGPTGGWYGKGDIVDYDRKLARDSNMLVMRDNSISGFVKFDKPGYLQARSYDDYFGDVYCGWAPNTIQIQPTKEPVFVSLSLCSVGDGGLDQVHEVIWFPESKKEGVLIFSSAHPMPGPPLKASSTYSKEQLGSAYQFNSTLANDLVTEYLRDGKISEAEEVISDSLKVLGGMRDYESSEGPVPAKKFHLREWKEILGYKLGLSLGKPSFVKAAAEYSDILKAEASNSHSKMPERVQNHMPLYQWLNQLYAGKKQPIPSFGEREKNHFYSSDPIDITDYLTDKVEEEKFVRIQNDGEFWVAVKNFASGNMKSAKQHIDRFLGKRHYGGMAVEIAAAANLRAMAD
jgi:hypothetical protein